MKKNSILSLLIALLLFSGCGIFKNRMVKLDTVDSLSESKQTSKVKEETKHIDTSSHKVVITEHQTDSTTTETSITPTPGKPFVVDPDGTFHGEAQNVNTKTTKKRSANKESTIDDKKGIIDENKKDSTGSKDQKTHLQVKHKDVVSEPNYKWIWYLAAVIGVVVLIVILYRKFKSKIPLI